MALILLAPMCRTPQSFTSYAVTGMPVMLAYYGHPHLEIKLTQLHVAGCAASTLTAGWKKVAVTCAAGGTPLQLWNSISP